MQKATSYRGFTITQVIDVRIVRTLGRNRKYPIDIYRISGPSSYVAPKFVGLKAAQDYIDFLYRHSYVETQEVA